MATSLFTRSLLLQKPTTATKTLLSSLLSRSFSSISTPPITTSSPLLRRALRPLSAALNHNSSSISRVSIRSFAVKATSSSLNDPSPNWSNRPPKETILLDGCDFNHWLVVVDKPDENMTRDDIIDSYIKTLAKVVGSEEEARMKIYSVSTQCYFAFGALVSEEVSYKIKELPHVRWVLPDSYLDVKNKDYGGEPFIDGKAVPYDPKYHEEWRRNNARANERNRRNDRPRSGDRSRNFDRRRENMQQRDGPPPPMANQAMAQSNMGRPAEPPPNNYAGGPPNMSGPAPNNYMGGPQNIGGPGGPPPPPNNYMGGPPNMGRPGGPPPNNYMGRPQNNMQGMPQQNNMQGMPQGMPQQNNMQGMPQGMPQQNNMQGMPQQNNMGQMQNTTGQWPNNVHGNAQQNFQNGPSYQDGRPNYQNSWDGNTPNGNAFQSSH